LVAVFTADLTGGLSTAAPDSFEMGFEAGFAATVRGLPGPALALALGFGAGVFGGSSIDFAVVGVVFVAEVFVVVVPVAFTVLPIIAWMKAFHSEWLMKNDSELIAARVKRLARMA